MRMTIVTCLRSSCSEPHAAYLEVPVNERVAERRCSRGVSAETPRVVGCVADGHRGTRVGPRGERRELRSQRLAYRQAVGQTPVDAAGRPR